MVPTNTMFGKKTHGDFKKSAQKIGDLKKDSATRYKHLKNVLEHIDSNEAKHFFEVHYSNIYLIFYDNFVIVETNLRQKELPFHIVHKTHKEELDNVLYILEKILIFCPELIASRWQCHSISQILIKLLHPGNSWKLRREAVKFFLIWYQILGDNASDSAHAIFATIVPGFPNLVEGQEGLEYLTKAPPLPNSYSPVTPLEIHPIYPPPNGEKPQEDAMKFYLDSLLEFMVTQVARIRWRDSFNERRHSCFNFLFEKFKRYYLPIIFKDYTNSTNVYNPIQNLPELRHSVRTEKYLNCRMSVIKWVANFTHDIKHKSTSCGSAPALPKQAQNINEQGVSAISRSPVQVDEIDIILNPEEMFCISFRVVRDVLFANRENINLVLTIFKQAFLLPFSCSPAIRRTIAVYKDWIQKNVVELPPFMLEPVEWHENSNPDNNINTKDSSNLEPVRLRNDSYVGAITSENFFVRAGLQNTLQLFIIQTANVFLLETKNESSVLLEEHVDICKRVLNMYRYMVMHTHMETNTWEQLLFTLLKITSIILSSNPPKKKNENLGGRLAQAVFQTLIVTWIKANLNVVISADLWNQFCDVLSSLTQWEDLIREWIKTMETLTRVLARHVYNLDLSDLPLDRLTEQKAKRKKGFEGGRKIIISNDFETKKIKTRDRVKSSEMEITDTCEPINEHKRLASCKLWRSRSDTHVCYGKKLSKKKDEFSLESDPTDSANNSFHTISLTQSEKKLKKSNGCKKWKSLDLLWNRPHDCSSEIHSRSVSPAPSSNSVKDAPIQIEVSQEPAVTVPEEDQKSVIAGGNVKGWLPDVAIILWKRMLGALGNVNEISNTNLHAQVFQYLIELSNTMIKMKLNQGVPEDNQKTPKVPELIPPLTIFASWCFQAIQLPPEYFEGKVCAYKVLCQTTLAVPDSCLSRLHISKYYNVLHTGLTSQNKNVVYAIMKYTVPDFFSRQLPGYTLLIPDFIHAAQSILCSEELKQVPRAEAASVLVTLLSFPHVIENFPSFRNNPNIADELKLRIVKILLYVAKKEQSGLARCVALSGLGIYLMQEFEGKSKHVYIKEAFNTVLCALKFNHEIVAQVACDIILLMCDYINKLIKWYPELASKTIEILTGTLSSLMPIEDGKKRLLRSLLLSLAEWTMRMPMSILLQHRSENNQFVCLLFYVFKVLEEISSGGRHKCINISGLFDTELLNEFNPNISVDDMKPLEFENRSFVEMSVMPTYLNSTRHSLQLAAKMISSHLLSNLGQFPIIPGASRLFSLVTEQDDNPRLTNDQLSTEVFSLPNLLMFVSTNNLIISLLELPALDVPGGGVTAGLITASSQVRILLRSLNGRFCWDASILYCTPEQLNAAEEEDERVLLLDEKKITRTDDMNFISYITSSSLRHTIRHRQPHVLPTVDNSAPDLDNLDDLLQYIGHTSPECLEDPETARNLPSVNSPLNSESEQETISTILNQKCLENDYLSHTVNLSPPLEYRPKWKEAKSSFQYSRLLLSQLGYLGWDMRTRLFLLQKTEKVLREIRNLDSQYCRETHKIAVIYVANGQEDKVSILSNTCGSQKYEDFIAALAWEIELENHTGFMGGLQRNKTTGATAPYYATSFSELVLHVSTRMSSSTAEALINKTRHLGNDEVHIVWSEHIRDYRRGIIPTEFCDILIVIYPLPHNLYRLQLSKKSEVPYFGPCLNDTIVDISILPNLVRMLAMSASRAKRSMLSFHQQHYEERYRSLETISHEYKSSSTFEEFSAQIYSPSKANSINQPSSKPESTSWSVNWQSAESTEADTTQGISPKSLKKLASKSAKRPVNTSASLTPPESPILRKVK